MTSSSARLFEVVVRPFHAFLRLEAASGIFLLFCALLALVWANVHPSSYHALFEYPIVIGAGGKLFTFTLRALINDGLMTLFFFVVGMEIKRELVVGELNTKAKALLPAIAALGGMILPATIFLMFNGGNAGQRGWGIPMATDIAFCIAVLTLLKDRIPHALIVFITALAIFDDIGGILVIALFYGSGVHIGWLLAALAVIVLLFMINTTRGMAYALIGAALWYTLHEGGIHATIAGVIVGLMIPARSKRSAREVLHELAEHVARLGGKSSDEDLEGAEILGIEEKLEHLQAPVERFVHLLHPFVAFAIMPLFALANSGVAIQGELSTRIALGVALGLFVGKQLGIFGFTMVAVKLGLAPIPGGASRLQLYGASIVAGIGFTVALFIATLAYQDMPTFLEQAKVGILLASFVAGMTGFLMLSCVNKTST